jgi:hypothetical protein
MAEPAKINQSDIKKSEFTTEKYNKIREVPYALGHMKHIGEPSGVNGILNLKQSIGFINAKPAKSFNISLRLTPFEATPDRERALIDTKVEKFMQVGETVHQVCTILESGFDVKAPWSESAGVRYLNLHITLEYNKLPFNVTWKDKEKVLDKPSLTELINLVKPGRFYACVIGYFDIFKNNNQKAYLRYNVSKLLIKRVPTEEMDANMVLDTGAGMEFEDSF